MKYIFFIVFQLAVVTVLIVPVHQYAHPVALVLPWLVMPVRGRAMKVLISELFKYIVIFLNIL